MNDAVLDQYNYMKPTLYYTDAVLYNTCMM